MSALSDNNTSRASSTFWLSITYLFNLSSVSQLRHITNSPLPHTGTHREQILAFHAATQEYWRRRCGNPLSWTFLHQRLPYDSAMDCVIVLEKPDGRCYCVVGKNGRVIDYAGSEEGVDVKDEDLVGCRVRYSLVWEVGRSYGTDAVRREVLRALEVYGYGPDVFLEYYDEWDGED